MSDSRPAEDSAKADDASSDRRGLVDLADRCERGEEAAVREFVARYERLLMSIGLRMLRDRQEAEDVVQESFVRILRSLSRWDRERPIVPWMTTITMNRCRTALERRSRRAVPVGDLPAVLAAGEPDPVERSETRDRLESVIAELPERWATAIRLFYQDELSVREVAERLDCAEGTIKTWLFRGRKRLAERLEELEAADPEVGPPSQTIRETDARSAG